jgi:hypothetical protein
LKHKGETFMSDLDNVDEDFEASMVTGPLDFSAMS